MQFSREKLTNEELITFYEKLILPRLIEEKNANTSSTGQDI